MSYGMRNIIKLSPGDDYGVYISRSRGPLGTSLQFRGPWDQVCNLDVEVHMRECVVKLYDPSSETGGGYKFLRPHERGLGVPERVGG